MRFNNFLCLNSEEPIPVRLPILKIMESLKLVAGGGAALDAYRRMLGPSFDYLGEVLRNRTEQTVEQFGDILDNAKRKLGDKIDDSGSVPPRVMKDVVEEGAYFESEIAAEYFGGVLAASRSKDGKDDRGSTFTKLLGRLSTYQISTHHYLYSTIRSLYKGEEVNLSGQKGRRKIETYIPGSLMEVQLRLNEMDEQKAKSVLDHSFFGLSREDLISEFKYGPQEELKTEGVDARSGIEYLPSAIGVSLYLWAHGYGDQPLSMFLSDSIEVKTNIRIVASDDVTVVRKSRWEDDKNFEMSEL